MTLAAASGSGLTILGTALTIPQTGNTVPTGALAIDQLPTTVSYGQTGSVAVMDPTTAIARCLSVTAASGSAGGTVAVSGFDLWGNVQTENITVTAGANTVNGNKAFKFVKSVTPQFTDTITISIGVADKVGYPLRIDRFSYGALAFNDTWITANTGFSAADQTSPATSTTSDTRGVYTLQSASDNVKRLQLYLDIAPANCATLTGVFGVTPA